MTDIAGGAPDDLAKRRPGNRSQLAGSVAAGTGFDRRSGLGAVAVTTLAEHDCLVRGLHGASASGGAQVDLRGNGYVATLHRAARARAAEGAAKCSAAPAEERLEDVGERPERLKVGCVAAAAQSLVTKAIVGRAPVAVGEHLIGLSGLLELLLGRGVAAVHIRVQLTSKAAEGLLDIGLARVARYAEHRVVIAGHVC